MLERNMYSAEKGENFHFKLENFYFQPLSPVCTFYGRSMTLCMMYFFRRRHLKMMSPQKWELLDSPPNLSPVITIFPFPLRLMPLLFLPKDKL